MTCGIDNYENSSCFIHKAYLILAKTHTKVNRLVFSSDLCILVVHSWSAAGMCCMTRYTLEPRYFLQHWTAKFELFRLLCRENSTCAVFTRSSVRLADLWVVSSAFKEELIKREDRKNNEGTTENRRKEGAMCQPMSNFSHTGRHQMKRRSYLVQIESQGW
jgi:hypothetical protein